MAISFNPGVNPDDYAKTYAEENNISVDAAKVALREKYGDPQKPQDVSIFDEANEVSNTNEAVTLANIDPNFVAQMYSELNGITLDEAIAELEEKLGVPDDANITDTIKNFIQNIINSITAKGEKAPDQGVDPDTYAQQYADANGLTLEEAKAELKEKMGEPVKPEQGGAERPQFDKNQDPDFYVRLYAAENNISYEEAKAYFESTYGVIE